MLPVSTTTTGHSVLNPITSIFHMANAEPTIMTKLNNCSMNYDHKYPTLVNFNPVPFLNSFANAFISNTYISYFILYYISFLRVLSSEISGLLSFRSVLLFHLNIGFFISPLLRSYRSLSELRNLSILTLHTCHLC